MTKQARSTSARRRKGIKMAQEAKKRSSMIRVTLAGLSGTTLEFYDHFIYGSAAALIFPHVFFVQMEPSLALLLSLVTYGVAFLARPLGAVIFGHFGDTIGRKNMLVLSLSIMGIATFLIGCLPSYNTAGTFGAYMLLVLRVSQGIALGGEWGGAALMINEYAKDSKYKSLLGSIMQIAAPLGFLMASGIFAIITNVSDNEFLMTWGWRIPFLLSAVLVFIGLYIRSSLEESPAFLETAGDERENAPIVQVFKNNTKDILLAIGTRIGSDIGFYVFALFPLVYLPHIGIAKEVALTVGIFAALGQMVGTPIFGYFCDKVGTKRILAVGAVLNLIWGFVYFAILNTKNIPLMMAGAFIALFLLAMLWAPLASHFPAMFPVEVRYTATGIGFQAAGIFGGAVAPTICLLLLQGTDSGYSISIYLAIFLGLAFFSTMKTKLRFK